MGDHSKLPSQVKVIETALSRLVGETCGLSSAGPALGSRVVLDYGKIITEWFGEQQSIPIESGEFSFSMGCADWRLSNGLYLLATSDESMEHEGVAHRNLQKLVGTKIAEFEVSPELDVLFTMSDGSRLSVLCSEAEEGMDQYTICLKEEYLAVECHGRHLELSVDSCDEPT